MAERPSEFVGSPNVDDGHCFATIEAALEILRLDPCERVAHSPDKSRQQGNRRKQGKRERLVRVEAPPGAPFDHGKFEIVVEEITP